MFPSRRLRNTCRLSAESLSLSCHVHVQTSARRGDRQTRDASSHGTVALYFGKDPVPKNVHDTLCATVCLRACECSRLCLMAALQRPHRITTRTSGRQAAAAPPPPGARPREPAGELVRRYARRLFCPSPAGPRRTCLRPASS